MRSLVRSSWAAWETLRKKADLVRIPAKGTERRGRVLYSYLKDPLLPHPDSYFDGHSNKWESREIARLFTELGYEVDAVDWSAEGIAIAENYDVVFDIYIRQQALLPETPNARRLLHLTGSDWHYQNRAELKRVRELEARRGRYYVPRRQVAHSDLMERALEVADSCSLIGNAHTLSTYPSAYSHKFTRVPVTASPSFVKSPETLVPKEREFLWFFGGGLVHKGLDLVLEAFSKNPSLRLNIIGDVTAEKDFVEIYRKELFESDNITVHGFLSPASPKFREVVERCFCFVAPSCSESISTAAATCMQIGLWPLLSRDTGIDLPSGSGAYLDHCSVDEILQVAIELHRTSDIVLREQIQRAQAYALAEYSRQNFSSAMRKYLEQATENVSWSSNV